MVSFNSWPLYSQEITLIPNELGSWVDPRAGMGILGKRKFMPLSGFEPLIDQPVT